MDAIAITILMIAMGATSFTQKTSERMVVAFVFSISILGFDLFKNLVDITPHWYYISAALVDLMVIMVISNINKPCCLADDILKISLISILYNFFGFYLLNEGYSDIVYRVMYFALYGWALHVLMRGEPLNDGRNKNNSWLYSLRFNAYSGHSFDNIK